jgi:tetratricopeptide (TPR) repeat protein
LLFFRVPQALPQAELVSTERPVTGKKRIARHRALITMQGSRSLRLLIGSLFAASGVMLAGCSNVTSHALNSEGVRLYQNGNYVQAAEQFQRAIASNPKEADGYYNLASALHKNAKLYNRQEDYLQAEQLYNQCLDYNPNHTECYRGLAVLLMDTGRQDAAFRLLEGWADRNPNLADPQIELARVLEETNNLPQASTRLVQALAIEPRNSRALTALGRLREVSGDPQQALANYQRSLAINRFQPAIAARVATLQATTSAASPLMAPPEETRTVQQWAPTTNVRY